MKKFFLGALLLIFLFPILVRAEGEKKKALYFYSESCSLCEEVDEYFSSQGFYDKYEIKKIEVSGSYNLNYLNEFFDVFGVNEEKRGWPAVVLGDEMLIGSQSIIEKFQEKMEKGGDYDYPIPLEIQKAVGKNRDLTERNTPGISSLVSFSMLFSASLIDSVSPCSFAVIIMLLSFVFFVNDRKKSFFLGIFFILGCSVTYFLIGFGFFRNSLDFLPFSKIISISMGIISLLISVFIARKVLRLKKTFMGGVISFLEEKMQVFFGAILNPLGSFLLGLASVLFLLPCASRPYLATARIFSLENNLVQSFISLVLYNLIFLFPMFIIFLVIFGIKSERVVMIRGTKMAFANERLVDAIMGAIMLFTGIYLIQNWI